MTPTLAHMLLAATADADNPETTMTQPVPPTADILDRAEPWLAQCGSCDAGLPMSCTCPEGDYRPVLAGLVVEVERLRAELVTR